MHEPPMSHDLKKYVHNSQQVSKCFSTLFDKANICATFLSHPYQIAQLALLCTLWPLCTIVPRQSADVMYQSQDFANYSLQEFQARNQSQGHSRAGKHASIPLETQNYNQPFPSSVSYFVSMTSDLRWHSFRAGEASSAWECGSLWIPISPLPVSRESVTSLLDML